MRTSTSSSELRRVRDIRRLLTILRNEYGDPHWWPGDTPFEIAVGAILTQRASWENVEMAISNLKRRRMLSPRALARAPLSDIERTIRPSGFYKQKARYVKALAVHVLECYGGDISAMGGKPMSELRDELLGIPGIGPETADSILLYSLDLPSFVVDAYTYRLLARLGMNPGRDYDALKTRFEESLDCDVKDLADMHALIVLHCKRHCTKAPRCSDCCVSARCPSDREEQDEEVPDDR